MLHPTCQGPTECRTPSLTTALLSQRPRGSLIPYMQPLRPALSYFAGEEGEGSTPRFHLFSYPSSGRAAIQKRGVRLVLLSITSLSICHFVPAHMQNQNTAQLLNSTTAPPSTYTAFYFQALHFQVTRWKQSTNLKGKKRKPHSFLGSFWYIINRGGAQDFSSTIDLLQLLYPASFVNTAAMSWVHNWSVICFSAGAQHPEKFLLRFFFVLF